jgi:hypothetical protein
LQVVLRFEISRDCPGLHDELPMDPAAIALQRDLTGSVWNAPGVTPKKVTSPGRGVSDVRLGMDNYCGSGKRDIRYEKVEGGFRD